MQASRRSHNGTLGKSIITSPDLLRKGVQISFYMHCSIWITELSQLRPRLQRAPDMAKETQSPLISTEFCSIPAWSMGQAQAAFQKASMKSLRMMVTMKTLQLNNLGSGC